MPDISPFPDRILSWFDAHGRKDLPWQHPITPYRVWISEIMLQQTQVQTVIPYYQAFMQRFPDLQTLADSPIDEVLKHWSGLGYYARARNLHKAAQQIRDEHSGAFPDTLEQVTALSGIGRSTASAILSIAFRQAHPILDGNVKRVLARFHTVEGWYGHSSVQKQLWTLAEQHVPVGVEPQRYADYTQAMMDLGATLCTRSKPRCAECPLVADCQAYQTQTVSNYPTPKPKRSLPERHAIMLLLHHDQEIYLERRPPTGIWGGLWSFPQFEEAESARDWLEKQGLDRTDLETGTLLPEYKHTFSHYRLMIQAIMINPQKPDTSSVMETSGSIWYNINDEFDGGLATPVQDLLKTFKEKTL